MDSGKYRHLIEVIEKEMTEEKDELGERIVKDVVKAQFFAEFENKTGNMLYGRAGDSKMANTTHKISYRYNNYPELSENQTIKINNQYYKINYIDDLDNRHEEIEVFIQRDNLRK